MNHEPEKKPKAGAPTPLDHPVDTRSRRDEEIRRQATEDAKRSFSTVRDLLKEGFGANP